MHEPEREVLSAASEPTAAGFPERLQRVLMNLQELQLELQSALRLDPTRQDLDRVLDEVLSFELISDLKATLDSLRTLLWAYKESAAEVSAGRARRADRMIELMRSRLGESHPDEGGRSFLMHIDRFVESRLRDTTTDASPTPPTAVPKT